MAKKIRVILSYVVSVSDDFPTHAMVRDIPKLVAHRVLSFARNSEETIDVEGGARLKMSAVGGRKATL